ncbi:MAG: HupE/UreJ family protein [Burkholderiales bacterium]|jgi:urease accessory protein|nr:HupE/UreJ family protein [Burkholderiales bacterium]
MRHFLKLCVLLSVALVPSLAFAHIGHGESAPIGFIAGFTHPFTGLDHLAAMLAVGIWSAMTTKRIWVAPVSFASLLLVGALLGVAGVSLPVIEPVIAASLLVIGLLIAVQVKLPVWAGALIVGAFAVFHGAAHGTELAEVNNVAGALIGMVVATASIHIAGLAIGRFLMRYPLVWARAAGGAVSVLGLGFLVGIV